MSAFTQLVASKLELRLTQHFDPDFDRNRNPINAHSQPIRINHLTANDLRRIADAMGHLDVVTITTGNDRLIAAAYAARFSTVTEPGTVRLYYTGADGSALTLISRPEDVENTIDYLARVGCTNFHQEKP